MAIPLSPSIYWGSRFIETLNWFVIYLILTQKFLCHEFIIPSAFSDHAKEAPEKFQWRLLQKTAVTWPPFSLLNPPKLFRRLVNGWTARCRVDQGNFTLSLSRNRTWKSPFIRLFAFESFLLTCIGLFDIWDTFRERYRGWGQKTIYPRMSLL